jgi:hypothetical protein
LYEWKTFRSADVRSYSIPRAAAKLAKARFTLPWAKILIPFGETSQQRRPVRIDFLAVFIISSSLLVAAGDRAGFFVAILFASTAQFLYECERGDWQHAQ